jgi:hypothetical protein
MSDQNTKSEAIVGGCEPVHAGDITQKEADLHILPSHGSYDFPRRGMALGSSVALIFDI